ncbi:hypothetical protein HaLaN_11848, partial [Haematococcus lacustris]
MMSLGEPIPPRRPLPSKELNTVLFASCIQDSLSSHLANHSHVWHPRICCLHAHSKYQGCASAEQGHGKVQTAAAVAVHQDLGAKRAAMTTMGMDNSPMGIDTSGAPLAPVTGYTTTTTTMRPTLQSTAANVIGALSTSANDAAAEYDARLAHPGSPGDAHPSATHSHTTHPPSGLAQPSGMSSSSAAQILAQHEAMSEQAAAAGKQFMAGVPVHTIVHHGEDGAPHVGSAAAATHVVRSAADTMAHAGQTAVHTAQSAVDKATHSLQSLKVSGSSTSSTGPSLSDKAADLAHQAAASGAAAAAPVIAAAHHAADSATSAASHTAAKAAGATNAASDAASTATGRVAAAAQSAVSAAREAAGSAVAAGAKALHLDHSPDAAVTSSEAVKSTSPTLAGRAAGVMHQVTDTAAALAHTVSHAATEAVHNIRGAGHSETADKARGAAAAGQGIIATIAHTLAEFAGGIGDAGKDAVSVTTHAAADTSNAAVSAA